MKKSGLLKIVNFLLLINFLSQGLTGLFHDSIPDETYEIIHGWGGLILVLLVIFHLILNWGWVKMQLKRK